MNVLRIVLNEDGSVVQFSPDFMVMRGSYRNVLINVEVPHSLLIGTVVETESNANQTGNNVRIGALIRTATGHNLQTKRYELQRVTDHSLNGVVYRLYQRKMPKEFTMWDTVNRLETGGNGLLELVVNVSNWVLDGDNAKVEQVVASPVFTLDVYTSAYLENAEDITEPSDLEILQSQTQEISVDVEELQVETAKTENKVVNLNETTQAMLKTVERMDVDLYGEEVLGDYLPSRLIAGNKINIENDSTKLKISAEPINASEVPIFTTPYVTANNVQGALEELATNVPARQNRTYYGGNAHTVWTKYDTVINGGKA